MAHIQGTERTHRSDGVLPSFKHHVQKLRVGQPLGIISQEELATADPPVFDQNRKLVFENILIIPNDDNMEPIIRIGTCLFSPSIVCFDYLEQTAILFRASLSCEGDNSRGSTSNST